MTHLDLETLAFANRLADAAGAVIRPYFRQRIDVIDKGKAAFDPVTAADRGAEEAIRALIERERPEDSVLGEEYGLKEGTSGRLWVLDPVDGTRAFITGRHTWGTLIGLEEGGRRVLGIIDQPVLRERFVAYNGTSELIANGTRTPMKTRACEDLAAAIVSTTHPWSYFKAEERAAFETLENGARMSYFGGDCYAYALLAMGFIDLVIEASLKHWDVAALEPVIANAGGVVSDWKGNRLGAGGRIIAAGDSRVHEAAVRMLECVG